MAQVRSNAVSGRMVHFVSCPIGLLLAALLLPGAAWSQADEGSEPEAAAAANPTQVPGGLDAGSHAGGGLVWRLENPFRFFTDARDTERHRALYASMREDEKGRAVLLGEQIMQQGRPRGWAADVFKRTCWNARRGRHGPCRDNPDYINPRFHRIIAGLADPSGLSESPAQPGAIGAARAPSPDCLWTITALPPSIAQAPGEAAGAPAETQTRMRPVLLEAACNRSVLLDIPYPAGALVSVALLDEGRPSVELASEAIKVRDIFVVGLGDSFASGEGNPDEPVRFTDDRDASYGEGPRGIALGGYPARLGDWLQIGDGPFLEAGPQWLSQACHRSLYGHQLRAALQLSLEDPHRAVTFAGFACSGAEITQGLFLPYLGTEWDKHAPDLPQISAASVAQCGTHLAPIEKFQFTFGVGGRLPALNDIPLARCPREKARTIDLLFLSVGGNDIGFSRLVANAVLADQSQLRWLGGWMGSVHGSSEAGPLLVELPDRFKALNRAVHGVLHIPWNQSDRVLLTAYPVMALLNDGTSVCPSGSTGMTVFPEFSLDRTKAWEGERAADQLYRTMAAAASNSRWSFVDAHRVEFAGHGICGGSQEAQEGTANDLSLPRLVDGQWQPFRPSAYQPYASRTRWFRTPNDAYLTGHYHVATTVARQVLRLSQFSWFQLVLASTYSGAFHPTAEGQAVMADALASRARDVLRRYDQ